MNPFSSPSDADWVDLFHQSRLTTRRGIDDATEAFLKHRIDQRALNTLFNIDKTHLVELIISEMDQELALNLLFSVERFTSPFTSSLTYKVINKFSQFDIFSPTPLPYAQSHKFKTYRVTLSSVAAILDGLFSLKPVDSGRRWGSSTGIKAKNPQQGSSSFDKTVEMLDVEPYKKLKLRFPKSASEVEKMIARLLMEIQKAFEFYLSFFREAQIQDTLKQAIVGNRGTTTSVGPHGTDATEKKDAENNNNHDVAIEMSGHRISSLTLDVESIRGFGTWKIFLSPAADTDLRRCSKKERGFFQIVVKKLRELSRGHFSASCNHKHVASPQNGIAIWKANVTDNTRLVYHIDLMDEQDEYGDRVVQVLIVHGLHTHDSFAPVPWDMISRRLGYRGREWRKRCSARKRVPGDLLDVYVPMTWENEALEKVTEPDTTSNYLVPVESEDDIKQMDAFFGQEKFVSFSKRLLHNMLANLDGEFPFEPSSKEREIVDYPYSCYVLGRSGTGKTITILYKMLSIERMYDDLSEDLDRPRQVFVTHSHVLVKKVKERFVKLYNTLVSTSCSPEELKNLAQAKDDERQEAEFGIQINVDDHANWPEDLPLRFSQLEPNNFPLFISYHHLCTLIENDIAEATAKAKGTDRRNRSAQKLSIVDYKQFETRYWKHFPEPLVRSLDPVTVYSEFMGVISGSEATFFTKTGYLNRTTYLQVAKNGEIAENVYDLFEIFTRRKKLEEDIDPAERTHTLLKAFRGIALTKLIGLRFDYMFLDEVQDYLLIDALLLRQLCVNPKGMIWAGDTAQTITKGSAFLFTQLTALLHRFEEERLSSARQEAQLPQPKTFQLTVNFRSHSGIVNVARSVVSIIQRFWPESLDKMEQERGRFPGPTPIFFKCWDKSSHQEGLKDSNKSIPFGSEQCIIVRDEDARERLKEQVGQLGLIFTIGESKGLEFDDVLIYGFFNDCVITEREWQLMIHAFDEGLKAKDISTRFDPMCFELKSLYVALTRAKNRLWLVDVSEKATPLVTSWLNHPTPVIEQSDEVASLTALGQLSTPEQWKAKGDELFSKKLYHHARQCYVEARQFFEVRVVDAHLSLEEAEYQRTPDAYKKAAREFAACADSVGYASKRSYYSAAADCFRKAEDYSAAIDHYVRAERFFLAIQLEIKLSDYDAALKTFLRYRTNLPINDRKSLEYDLRHHFFETRSFQLLNQLFDDGDAQFTFFGSTKDKEAQEEHLLYHRRYDQAAQLRIEQDDTLAGIKLFLRAQNFQMAKAVIFRELWLQTSFQDVITPLVKKLLQYADSIPASEILTPEAEELRLLRLLSQARKDQSAVLQYGNAFSQANRPAPALLALDEYLTSLQLRHLPHNELQQACAALQMYIMLSQKLLSENTHTTAYIQQFGLRQTSSLGSVSISPVSVLFSRLPDAATSKKSIKISARTLESLSRNFIAERVTTIYNTILREGYLAHINGPCLVHRRWEMTRCPLYHLSSRPSIGWISSWINFTLTLATIRPIRGVSEQFNAPDMRLKLMRPVLEGLLMTDFAFPALETLHAHASMQMLPLRLREFWNLTKRLSVGFPDQSQLTLSLLNIEACLSINRVDLVESCPSQHFQDSIRYSSRGGYGQQGALPPFPMNMYLLKAGSSVDVCEGVKFFRALLRTKCPVNLGVVLPAIGRISALFLEVCLRAVNRPTYAGIIIPRSWARIMISSQEAVIKSSTALLGEIIELFELLLYQLSTLGESRHLIYGTEDSSLEFCEEEHIRDDFIAQCLTYFCLLGYNLPDSTIIASRILFRLDQLRCYYPYVQCSSIQRILEVQQWQDILEIVCEGQTSRPFNEIIQIHFKGTPLPHPVSGARIITYTDLALSDLKAILDQPPANIQPQVLVQSPANINQTQDTSAPVVSEPYSSTPSLQDATTSEVSASEFLTESYLEAVATIEMRRAHDRNTLQRLEKARQEEQTLDHEFVRCLDYAQSNNLSQPYRIRLLGLLPLILFSLKAAKTLLQDKKKENSSLLLSAEGTALELAQAELSFATTTVKKIGPCFKQLDLDAGLHSLQDTAALMLAIRSAVSCLEKVRQTCKGEEYKVIVNCLNLLVGVKWA